MSTAVGPDHDRYAEWDGAYLLGALSAVDRRAYQAHLDACPACLAAVAELAALPGLLGRVDQGEAAALLADPADLPMPDDLLGRLTARAGALDDRDSDNDQDDDHGQEDVHGPDDDHDQTVVPLERPTRPRRRRVVVALAAAVVIIALAVGIPVAVVSNNPAPSIVTLSQTVPSALSAQATLTGVRWGTKITMSCSYAADPQPTGAPVGRRPYTIVVIGTDGAPEQAGAWRAGPGETVTVNGSSSLQPGEIRQVQVRSASGRVLLAADVR